MGAASALSALVARLLSGLQRAAACHKLSRWAGGGPI